MDYFTWKNPSCSACWRRVVESGMKIWGAYCYELSRRQWKTGKPGVLQLMGSQRVGHSWATEQLLWWVVLILCMFWKGLFLCSLRNKEIIEGRIPWHYRILSHGKQLPSELQACKLGRVPKRYCDLKTKIHHKGTWLQASFFFFLATLVPNVRMSS